MRHGSWLCFVVMSLVLFGGLAGAAETKPSAQTAAQSRAFENLVDELAAPGFEPDRDRYASRGERINQAFVTLTGEAINPLFGVTVLGMYTYFKTDEALRDHLPVYYRPEIWIPLLVIMLLMLFNSTIAEAIPFLKTPLNALGDVVNTAGAIFVLPLVIKMFADSVAAPAGREIAWTYQSLFPVANAAEAGMVAGGLWTALGWLAGAVLGAILYLAVWLTFNMVDVLILICPFPGVDAVLKSFRLGVIGLLTGVNQVSPTAAFVIAAVVVAVSLVLAGWSFRLSVFGIIFATDLLFFRRSDVDDGGLTAFAGDGLARGHRIPMRTLGRLERGEDGGLEFTYRPWLIMARRRVALGRPGDFAGGRGLLNPFLVLDSQPDTPLLRMPPRYRGQEETIASAYGLTGVVDCGVAGKLRTWLASFFGTKTPAAA